MTTTDRPPRHELAMARLITGSIGHGVAGALDLLEFAARLASRGVRRRAGRR